MPPRDVRWLSAIFALLGLWSIAEGWSAWDQANGVMQQLAGIGFYGIAAVLLVGATVVYLLGSILRVLVGQRERE